MFLYFYNTHTTRAVLYRKVNTTHHTKCIQHVNKNHGEKIQHKKIQHKTFFLFRLLTSFASFLSILSISSTFLVKNNFFPFDCLQWFCLEIMFSGSQLCFDFMCYVKIWILNVRLLLRLLFANNSASCKAVNFKTFFCAYSHCSSIFLNQWSTHLNTLKRYNALIQHSYTTRSTCSSTTLSSYNKFIPHAGTTRKSKN